MQPTHRFVKSNCAIVTPRSWLLANAVRGFEIFDRRDWR